MGSNERKDFLMAKAAPLVPEHTDYNCCSEFLQDRVQSFYQISHRSHSSHCSFLGILRARGLKGSSPKCSQLQLGHCTAGCQHLSCCMIWLLWRARAVSHQIRKAEMSCLFFFFSQSEPQLFIWRGRMPTIPSPNGHAEDQLAFVKHSSQNDEYHRKAHEEINISLIRTRCE